MNLGLPELLVILVILMLLFGASRLPKLARSIGQSAKELQDGISGKSSTDSDNKKEGKSKKS